MEERTNEKIKRIDEDQNTSDDMDTQKGKYMTFKSGNEYFGLEIQYIIEIIQLQAITAIPETEDYIKGLINLRGNLYHCNQYEVHVDRIDRGKDCGGGGDPRGKYSSSSYHRTG